MHYHIDTDMGVDDGLALLLANRLIGEGVTLSTVFGNVSADVATRNAKIFRALLGRRADWPLFTGASCARDGFRLDATHVHGEDGLGGATEGLDHALLEELAHCPTPSLSDAASPGKNSVILIGLGPATNIPGLVSWYGRNAVARIVLMSGVYFDVGNITQSAEFNAHCDPHALRETLDLGIPTLLVPLDVCRKVLLPRATMTAFRDAAITTRSRLIATSHIKYMDFYERVDGVDGCYPHDSVTLLAALYPERFYSINGVVSVEVLPKSRGRTTVTLCPSHIGVVTGGNLRWLRETIGRTLSEDACSTGGA